MAGQRLPVLWESDLGVWDVTAGGLGPGIWGPDLGVWELTAGSLGPGIWWGGGPDMGPIRGTHLAKNPVVGLYTWGVGRQAGFAKKGPSRGAVNRQWAPRHVSESEW